MTEPEIFAPNLLAGRTALVTGGATGIGLAIARELGGLGARIVIAARQVDRLEAAATALRERGIEVYAHPVNIRREDEVEALFHAVDQHVGLPDILVNNAGGQFAAPALDISPNGFRAVVDLNLNGTWLMSKAFAARAVAAGQPGRIVNIVLSLFSGTPGMVHSGAARAGVINMTKTLAVEWGRHGITVNAIAPGTIDTEGLAQYDVAEMEAGVERQPIKRMGSAREVALAAAYLVSPAGDFITGTTIIVDGGDHLMGAAASA
jgi:NAD(P)-dependent dehydrogenase (short-subunit alcohol dehydrogenase family)